MPKRKKPWKRRDTESIKYKEVSKRLKVSKESFVKIKSVEEYIKAYRNSISGLSLDEETDDFKWHELFYKGMKIEFMSCV